jgi:serine/threonine protein kinase
MSTENGACRLNPRLYIVLRRLGLGKLHKTLTEERNVIDLSFPFPKQDLEDIMNKEQRVSCLQMQHCVLTEDSAAVTCENGGHAHFGNEDQIPFERIRILGTGGFAQVKEVTSKTTGRAFARKLLHRLDLVRAQSSVHRFANELKILRKL